MSANVDFVITDDGIKYHFGRCISPKTLTIDFDDDWESTLVAADLGPQLTQLVRHFGAMATAGTTVRKVTIAPREIILKTWEGFDNGLAQQRIAGTIGAGRFVEDRKSRIARIGR